MPKKPYTRVLYIAPFSDKAYGAEEQDIESGWTLLQSRKNVKSYYIKIDLQKKQVNYDSFDLSKQYKLKVKHKLAYFFNLILTPDNAMRQAYTYKNYKLIMQMIFDLDINLIYTNTTSTVLFGNQKKVTHVFRSVSFEPVYVLKTVDNYFFARAHSLLKYLSVFQELRADYILAISPRDAKYYKRISGLRKSTNISIVPLRQLTFHKQSRVMSRRTNPLNVGFMGSTYNVLHNRKSFDFIVDKLDYEKLASQNVIINIYGRKSPILKTNPNNLKIHNYVKDINKIYQDNLVFLVPYFLASGMQSKVFEPLFYGKILICDPRVLAGYSYMPFVHYIPASTPEDFMSALYWVKSNSRRALLLGDNARSYSYQIFDKQNQENDLKALLNVDGLLE
jgi:hypothetical protein